MNTQDGSNDKCNLLWEILVPTRIKNKGVSIEHHYSWDNYVRDIAGGLTVYRAAKCKHILDLLGDNNATEAL